MRLPFPLLLAVVGLLVGPSVAVHKTYFYNYGEDAGDSRLPDFDEISSAELALRAPIIFYGQIYNSIFVNSNGFISFLTEIPNFFNVQFPLDYPVVAPFYSDVDAREAGAIWYRETSDPATVSRAKFDLTEHFSSAANFNPTGVFIVTWDGVGPYNQRTDRVNTYQLVLVTDSEDSYAMFHYADGGIQWLQGDGKNPSLPDARGQAGLMSGDGRFFILRDSGKDQVRSLDKRSNSQNPGVWMFRVGQLDVDENVYEPDHHTEEEEEEQEHSGQTAQLTESCATGGSLCHSNAVCNDYSPGFCCSCDGDYFGNGINCLMKEQPIRVTGKVIGNINGVNIEDSDLHSYVLTAEGRSYTALSRIPSQIGYDIQSLTGIGTGIAWLFAKPIEVPNGFTMTGGKFNRTVEINFPQTSHNVVVQQQFQGLDVFNYIEVKTQVTGSVPTVPIGSKIEMDAFNEEYTPVKPGQLRSRSSRVFRLKGQTIDTPFSVETIVDYDECAWMPSGSNGHATLRLKVAENIFIQYDAPEEIVRYALSAKVSPLEEVDPCVEGRQECGENSQCVVDRDSFRCVCERGYSEVYDSTLNKGICLDMNECDTGRDNCHISASCVNTPGSFSCSCKPGFTGDGVFCEEEGSCDGVPCDPNAMCHVASGTPHCVCRSGFIGDGFKCTSESETSGVVDQRDCVDADICSPYANCVYDDIYRSFRCVCYTGYSGDGQTCTPTGQQESCGGGPNCSPYGMCIRLEDGYRCECQRGFIGDGYTCDVDNSYSDLEYNYTQPHPQQPHQPPQQPYPPPEQPYQPPQQPYQPPQQPYHPPEQPYHPPEQPYHPSEQPYQPSQQPYQPSQQPYQPPEAQQPQLPDGWLEPECLFNVCFCPANYTHNYEHNKCVPNQFSPPQATVVSTVVPFCGVAKCTCPYGYTYNEALNICNADAGGLVEARPLPECVNGNCICPAGYLYRYSDHSCHPSSDPGYNYNIMGGGTRNRDEVEARPLPECVSGNCICPAGYLYRYSDHSCQPSGDHGYNYNIMGGGTNNRDGVEARPLPECVFGNCICPTGYLYHYSDHNCQPSRDPGYNYNIMGGGTNNRVSCNEVNTCHPNAQCIYESYSQTYHCQCHVGYDGDGYHCSELDVSCDNVDICNIHAQCVFDDSTLKHVCVCSSGYQGDGLVCTPQDECSSVSDCDVNAQCLYDGSSHRYRCACNTGFSGDGRSCSPMREAGCKIVNNCDANAECIYDTYELEHRCQCRDGFDGDGSYCLPVQIGCNVVANCGVNGECSYDQDAQGYRCRCRQGFEGDGFFCQARVSCREDLSVCHPQASCRLDPASSFGVSCRCREGFTGDGFTCLEASDHERNLLLLNQGLAIFRMPLDSREGPGFIIHFEAFMTAVGADIDCRAGRYYWTDVRSTTIRSSQYDGSERQPIVSRDIGFPEDVAVDWVSGNVYWTDSKHDIVAVASVDGEERQRTVINDSLVNPRGIAVHPGLGMLFWSDWNRLGPKIEASGMDGSGRTVLVDQDISLPNSLVVDYETAMLCWADAGTHTIECIGMDGQGRRKVMEGARYPFGLTLAGRNFYYSDWNDTKVHTVDRYSGLEAPARAPPLGGSGKLYGITAVPAACPPVSNVCGVSSGGCPSTHLCLPNGRGGRTCACPNQTLQDGTCTDLIY